MPSYAGKGPGKKFDGMNATGKKFTYYCSANDTGKHSDLFQQESRIPEYMQNIL
jgi:hypothetical protein